MWPWSRRFDPAPLEPDRSTPSCRHGGQFIFAPKRHFSFNGPENIPFVRPIYHDLYWSEIFLSISGPFAPGTTYGPHRPKNRSAQNPRIRTFQAKGRRSAGVRAPSATPPRPVRPSIPSVGTAVFTGRLWRPPCRQQRRRDRRLPLGRCSRQRSTRQP